MEEDEEPNNSTGTYHTYEENNSAVIPEELHFYVVPVSYCTVLQTCCTWYSHRTVLYLTKKGATSTIARMYTDDAWANNGQSTTVPGSDGRYVWCLRTYRIGTGTIHLHQDLHPAPTSNCFSNGSDPASPINSSTTLLPPTRT